MICLRAFRDSY